MRHSIWVKFMVIILCTLSLVTSVAGGAGIFINESYGMYTKGLDKWMEQEMHEMGNSIAYQSAALYAAEHLGGCTEAVLNTLRAYYYYELTQAPESWEAAIYQNGVLLEGTETPPEGAWTLNFVVQPAYPTLWEGGSSQEAPNESSYHYWETIFVYNETWGGGYDVELAYTDGPVYEVVLYMQPAVLNTFRLGFVEMMYTMRYQFVAMMVAGLLLFAVTLVYLCCVAGRRPKGDQVSPGALNRLPLDLYLAVVITAEAMMGVAVGKMLYTSFEYGGSWAIATMIGLAVFGMALLVVAIVFAGAAQIKAKGGFWWRRSLLGWCLMHLYRVIRLMLRSCGAVFGMLPIVWQWLTASFGTLLLGLLSLVLAVNGHGLWRLVGLVGFCGAVAAFFAMVSYWAYCMGHLMKGVLRMNRGDLHYQIPTRYLRGTFRTFAERLNSLADAARLAAERQLKSERMKTELITNVSHDIKTPLTSIINYVDLLQKPHDGEQEVQYLEVLERQSQRLKKLIEDLMEMSKASTGNIAVEMGDVDAVETINQALGEFSDKLDLAGLCPVFRYSGEPMMIQADGKLLWRVLSNLMSNAVKYAMPGTRFYLDLVEVQGNAVLSLKNISREQLNIDAEELMERFVRGDTARNTEGSGLGLNIAKSLVELQQGQMELMVDGDLFKVTVMFPLAR